MFSKDLADLIRRRPFKPFRITLTDGRSYEIRHPEIVMLGKTTVIVGFPAADEEEPVFDRFKIVDLLHIMEAEPIDAEAK
jgi:hypothetical protein